MILDQIFPKRIFFCLILMATAQLLNKLKKCSEIMIIKGHKKSFYFRWQLLLYLTDLCWLGQNWERTSLSSGAPPYEPGPAQGFSLFRERFTATVGGPPSVREAPGNDREAGEGDSLHFSQNQPAVWPIVKLIFFFYLLYLSSLPSAVSNF